MSHSRIRNNVLLIPVLTAFALTAIGCATTYSGRAPRFDLKDQAEKDREVAEFSIQHDFWGTPSMNGTRYYSESLEPVVRSVSPTAYSKLESGQTKVQIGQIMFMVGFLGFGGSFFVDRDSTPLQIVGGVLAIGGLSVEMWGHFAMRVGYSQYNFDLRDRVQNNKMQISQMPYLNVAYRF